jgi:hypothetical protein
MDGVFPNNESTFLVVRERGLRLSHGPCKSVSSRTRQSFFISLKGKLFQANQKSGMASYDFPMRRIPSMGGERSSPVRQRLLGKICDICKRSLPPPHRALAKSSASTLWSSHPARNAVAKSRSFRNGEATDILRWRSGVENPL